MPGSFRSTASEKDRKSTRLNSSHVAISYAVCCLKKKKRNSARRVAQRNEQRENSLQHPARLSAVLIPLNGARPSSATPPCSAFFFFNDTATTKFYPLSLHDALPI